MHERSGSEHKLQHLPALTKITWAHVENNRVMLIHYSVHWARILSVLVSVIMLELGVGEAH